MANRWPVEPWRPAVPDRWIRWPSRNQVNKPCDQDRPCCSTSVVGRLGHSGLVLLNFQHVWSDQRSVPVYAPRGGSRSLRVLMDESSAGPIDRRQGDVFSLLRRQLGRSDNVIWWRYADEGPPPGTPRVAAPFVGTATVGWVVAERILDHPPVSHDVRYDEGEKVVIGCISGDVGRADILSRHRTDGDLPVEEASQRRGAASVAYGAALAAKADLLVTGRPFLLSGGWFPGRGTICCGPTEAVALLGQFLRARGEYWIRSPHSPEVSARTNKGLFFWIAARALLPSGWAWQDECLRAANQQTTDTSVLALSAFQRMARAIVVRDSLRWYAYLPQNNDVIDDLMAELDVFLINIVGAFDAVARVTHRLLGLAGSEYNAGWQRKSWLSDVRVRCPEIAAVMESGSRGADLFEVVRRLRNTVHGAPIQALGTVGAGSPDTEGTAMRLPRDDVRAIVAILERRGWSESLGLEDWGEAGFLVSPLALVEMVIPVAAMALDALMAVPLGSELGARIGHLSTRLDGAHEVFDEVNLADVLLQLGLSRGSAQSQNGH